MQPMTQRGRNNAAQGNALGRGFGTNRSPVRAGQFSKAASALRTKYRSPQIAYIQRFAGYAHSIGRMDKKVPDIIAANTPYISEKLEQQTNPGMRLRR